MADPAMSALVVELKRYSAAVAQLNAEQRLPGAAARYEAALKEYVHEEGRRPPALAPYLQRQVESRQGGTT